MLHLATADAVGATAVAKENIASIAFLATTRTIRRVPHRSEKTAYVLGRAWGYVAVTERTNAFAAVVRTGAALSVHAATVSPLARAGPIPVPIPALSIRRINFVAPAVALVTCARCTVVSNVFGIRALATA